MQRITLRVLCLLPLLGFSATSLGGPQIVEARPRGRGAPVTRMRSYSPKLGQGPGTWTRGNRGGRRGRRRAVRVHGHRGWRRGRHRVGRVRGHRGWHRGHRARFKKRRAWRHKHSPLLRYRFRRRYRRGWYYDPFWSGFWGGVTVIRPDIRDSTVIYEEPLEEQSALQNGTAIAQQVLQNNGLVATPCAPNTVLISLPTSLAICAQPTEIVPAGFYQVQPPDGQLVNQLGP